MWVNKKRYHKQGFGFTLIEMSLVTGLIAMIGLAVYGSLSSGMKIWQRANKKMPEVEINIFFDKISNDIRNWLIFSAIVPEGKRGALSFPLMQEKGLTKDKMAVGFGKVRYYFDKQAGCVYRDYQDYSQLAAEAKKSQPQLIISGIESLSFKYYYFDIAVKRGSWDDELDKEIPSAVKIDINFEDNKKIKKLTKIITVYVWGAPV